MGRGSYDDEAHQALVAPRANLPIEQVYTQTSCHSTMDPHGVAVRESRDSALHPESNAIIFALDVSGSMGDIPGALARNADQLPRFMRMIMDGRVITDPQLMFMAIFDANSGQRNLPPFQVGQFESEAQLMDQWLTRMYLTGGGGPIDGESYEFAPYFAARHIAMDCWEKRQRKGYLFITGDEPHFGTMSPEHVHRVFGDRIPGAVPIPDVFVEAAEKFHIFFLIPDPQRARRVEQHWREVLGERVIVLGDFRDTCTVSATLIGLTEGTLADLDAAGDMLERLGCDRVQVNRVIRAVEPYATLLGRGGLTRPSETASVPRRRRT